MPRTPRVVALLTVVALLATACDDEPRARPQEPPRVPDGPNVVIIMVDDLRAAGTVRGMKALRRHFRREGTEYTRAFATTPLCCPSRASIMTGLYVHNHNVETNDGRGFDQYPQDLTVQAQLQRAGYTTGYFGKYLNKWPIEEPPPYFDRWVTNSFGNPYFSGEYNIQGEVRDVHEYSTKYLTDELLSFIGEAERDDERPWFGVLAPNAVHGPSLPAVRFRELDVGAWEGNPAVHEADRSDKPARVRATQRTLADSQEIRSRQLRALRSVDVSIRRLFRELRALGEDEDTLAFYMSDNGQMWSEHGLTGKTYAYIPSSRIPLFMRWPGRVEAGVTDDRLVANIDVVPTILEAAELAPAEPLDGRSLFGSGRRDRLVLEYWRSRDFATGPWAALLTERDQYVEYYNDEGKLTFREYYDLERDPWQLENLLADDDATNDPDVAALSRRLQADRRCRAEGCP